MPQEPKRRHSKARQGKRRASIKLELKQGVSCKNCGQLTFPHMACINCGYYKQSLRSDELKGKHEKPV